MAAGEQAPLQVVREVRVPAVATGTSTEFALAIGPFAGSVLSVSFTPDALVTGVNTDTRKWTVKNKGAAGAGTTAAASLQANSGVNAPAFDEKAITLDSTAANRAFAQDDVLSWHSEAVGTGLADPGGLVKIVLARA